MLKRDVDKKNAKNIVLILSLFPCPPTAHIMGHMTSAFSFFVPEKVHLI
jgi:hypothetical protein